jgi:hypothetical protein
MTPTPASNFGTQHRGLHHAEVHTSHTTTNASLLWRSSWRPGLLPPLDLPDRFNCQRRLFPPGLYSLPFPDRSSGSTKASTKLGPFAVAATLVSGQTSVFPNLVRTFLLGVGLTDLGQFGRYFGQKKEIVSVFNGSVVYFNVGIGLTFLGRCCSTRHELYFQLPFEKYFGR